MILRSESLLVNSLLEQEFRNLAQELPEEQWRTSHYLELIRQLDESGETQLLDYLQLRRASLRDSLESYRRNQLLEQEVTEETLAGHRLLEEGIQGWIQGVDMLMQVVPKHGNCEPALDRIEVSNRVLVSVQRLHQRVVSQTSSPKRSSSWNQGSLARLTK